MHKNVELLIGRLATDPELQRRFAEQPLEAIRGERLELSAIEVEALAAIDPAAFRALADALDPRLKKASLASERRAAGSETTTTTQPSSMKEICS